METLKQCYKSVSCVLSVLIIVFVLGSICWDMFVTKPQIRRNIDEIKIEIQNINKKIDKSYVIFDDYAVENTSNIENTDTIH